MKHCQTETHSTKTDELPHGNKGTYEGHIQKDEKVKHESKY